MLTMWDRAQKVLIDGTGTFSKKPQCFVEGSYPTHCLGGSGATIIGENGERYIDWMCGLGANLSEIHNVYTLPHVCEVDFAELIVNKFPCDKIKILKSGSCACEAAIRYARAFTGRSIVYGTGYHGWHNAYVAAEKPGLGCVDEKYHKFNTLEDMISALDKTDYISQPAAVIIEPVVSDLAVEPTVKLLREKCHSRDVLFIADEIVSGGRTLKYCFSNLWDLDPDIICLGKALGGGYPLGIVGVRNRCLIDGCFVSTTFSGETTTIREAIKFMRWLTEDKIQQLWEIGAHLQNEFNRIAEKHKVDIRISGYPTRAVWQGNENTKAIFWEQMIMRGHLCGAAWFITFCHTESVVVNFLDKAESVLECIAHDTLTLMGIAPRPVFKRV